MRSISLKLIISFLAVGLLCVILIVVLTYWNTGREFRTFVVDQNRSNLVRELGQYYAAHGSWEGVNSLSFQSGGQASTSGGPPTPPFILMDSSGTVIVAGNGAFLNAMGPVTANNNALPVVVNNQQVGTVVVDTGAFQPRPAETTFIQRNMWLLIYSAIGAVLLALVTAIFLSRSITRPIRELTQATNAVANGELGRQVKVRARDEIGSLSVAFNKMSSDLQRSVKMRKQMTADIAHELRTPLSIILGHTDAVHDGVIPASSKNFEIVREEAARLDHIVEDLRTLSLADAGELSLNLQKVSVENMIMEISEKYALQLRKKDLNLKTEVQAHLPGIKLDPDRINQVLKNVLDNAIRHTPRKGTITISAKKVEAGVELSVEDSGEGVKPEDLERIFDRLYRASQARERDAGGSGLGLAIAKSIVELHKGKITAEKADGKGLRIKIQIPSKA
jgi:two-component system sensor histidine kinase BaeS